MLKNNFLSKIFGSEAKTNKLIKRMKKIKKEYDDLDNKLLSGTISKQELDKYYNIKEELNKMVKKFMLKDGKFVLKTDETEGEKMDNNTTNNIDVKEEINKQVIQEQTQQNQQEAQFRAQQEAQMRAQQEAQFRAQQEAQMRAQEEAQQQPQNNDLISVFLTVQDLPELTLKLNIKDAQLFEKKIEEAIIQGIPFRFGPVVVNGSKILMYRFD
jgi:hypothetical protein